MMLNVVFQATGPEEKTIYCKPRCDLYGRDQYPAFLPHQA